MSRTAMWLFTTLNVFLTSNVSAAEIYRCVVDGKPRFTDRPCADGEVVRTQDSNVLDTTSKPVVKADVTKEDSRRVVEERRTEVEAHGREIQAQATQREKGELWKRRNMSVDCIARLYNGWVVAQSPRPTPEQIDSKIGELRRECRDKLGIPPDTPPTSWPVKQK